MNSCAIQPFELPSTVAFIDDNLPFLSNLSLLLDSRLAFRLFQSPCSALDALNAANAVLPIVDKYFSIYQYRGDTSYAHHVIELSLDTIHREIYNESRFEPVSVVVVDYDMPEINGLEFCRQLGNPAIKKILLTGIADEQIVVKAFNEKIIDRFIRKQDSGAMSSLNQAVDDLQREYGRQINAPLADALSVGAHGFLRDAGFAEHFSEIRQRLGIVEHYLSCNPDGILMIDASGSAYLLIVQTEESLRESYEIASDQDAPEALLAQLRSRRSLPCFWKTEGNYAPIYHDWPAYLHPATLFKGKDVFFYALVKNPGAFNMKRVISYGEYLERLDLEARQGTRCS